MTALADDLEGQDAQAAFFAGLDLKEAGDCEGAVARFQLALGRDPDLHQARLHMAECYHALGLDEEAITELVVYLGTPFPGMEDQRARDLLVACGGDPDSVVVGTQDDSGQEDSGEGGEDHGGGGGDGEPPPAKTWTPLRLEVGACVQHYSNRIGLTAAGPVVGVRILPVRFVELGVDGAFGFGSYPEHDGTVRVPTVSFSLGASIPIQRVRVIAGVVIPLVMSRPDDSLRVDPGVMGEVGVRVALGNGRIVVGGQVGGGTLIKPTVGGGVTLGVQIGPLGGAR